MAKYLNFLTSKNLKRRNNCEQARNAKYNYTMNGQASLRACSLRESVSVFIRGAQSSRNEVIFAEE